MWTISRIDEADYGCEERLPGEPLMALVTLESDDGRMHQFEMPDEWLIMQKLDIGDEWPDDLDAEDSETQKATKQATWMDLYLGALEELEASSDFLEWINECNIPD